MAIQIAGPDVWFAAHVHIMHSARLEQSSTARMGYKDIPGCGVRRSPVRRVGSLPGAMPPGRIPWERKRYDVVLELSHAHGRDMGYDKGNSHIYLVLSYNACSACRCQPSIEAQVERWRRATTATTTAEEEIAAASPITHPNASPPPSECKGE